MAKQFNDPAAVSNSVLCVPLGTELRGQLEQFAKHREAATGERSLAAAARVLLCEALKARRAA